jgi:RNA recognition motif-containing protein
MSTAVDNLADNLKNASTEDTAAQESISASAAEGRRLYIGNLAYATTEAELKQFFSGFDVYVSTNQSIIHCLNQSNIPPASLPLSPSTPAPTVLLAMPLSI